MCLAVVDDLTYFFLGEVIPFAALPADVRNESACGILGRYVTTCTVHTYSVHVLYAHLGKYTYVEHIDIYT